MKRSTITRLWRRFVLGALTTMLGFELLVVWQMNRTKNLIEGVYRDSWFLVEILPYLLVVLGLVMVLRTVPEMYRRLSRIEAMGEHDW